MNFDKSQIARQFSRAAPTYDSVSQLQSEMADQLIGSIPVGVSGRLVDLGCGTGTAMERIDKLGRFELTGIDIASGMIECSKKRVPSAHFICCDLERTPMEADSMDVVFSNAAIQWCHGESAVKEMMRVSRPGGIVVASTFGPGTLQQWRSTWRSTWRVVETEPERIHTLASRQEIERIFHETGFEAITVLSIDRLSVFHSVDAMFASIKRLGATNATNDRRRGMLGRKEYQLIRSVFEQRLVQDGELRLTFECIFITASKPLNVT